ncbi:inositol monophosphatase family protein [Nocardioides sp. AX2bis]|uniref:inositol monophosphatase family protein n=1 Tax=Nocardioides sp. AX2bis TaxID=2653157 RepID=UPI0012EFF1F7|nr:inositol monophosphatase [Nocardioides sp. AX2bis]VXB10931.1 Inositol monophosphatase [Nocardioides sp. AX2bis]
MDTDAVLELVQDVAARVITPRFRALDDADISEKNPGDLVTVADREAEVEITAALRAAYPGAVVLGEEAYAEDPSVMERYAAADHAFTVDPVDGTKNFVHGSPDHAVMVAELQAGEVVRSWIWQPQHEAAYVAERGAGAWRNGVRLTRPSPGPDPAAWKVATSRRGWVGRELPGLEGTAPMTLTWVCCGIDYPHLVAGDTDVLLYSGALPWDHAPGTLLLTESGGRAAVADGRAYDPTRPHRATGGGPLVCAADEETYRRVGEALGTGALDAPR